MKTATEILFEDCKIIGGDNPSPNGRDSFICVVTFDVIQAMEEYAKQEALGFYEWKKNYEWEFDFRQEECPLSDDELWNEYQKSKVK